MSMRLKVWLLFFTSVFGFVLLWVEDELADCREWVRADEVSRWVEGLRWPVSFSGGVWVDGGGVVVGRGVMEDSDVCVR